MPCVALTCSLLVAFLLAGCCQVVGTHSTHFAACSLRSCCTEPEVAGVLHASGVLQDATIPQQTARGVHTVFASKACGAAAVLGWANLQPLQAIKLFSSIASAMGSGGQANYAAANAVMDAWAHGSQTQACSICLMPDT